MYAFGSVAFDHNFSQGLDLQQTYGGGFGWTLVKDAKQTLDLKGSIDYQRQSFQLVSEDRNLVVSVFTEDYVRTFAHGICAQGAALREPGVERFYCTRSSLCERPDLSSPCISGSGST